MVIDKDDSRSCDTSDSLNMAFNCIGKERYTQS